MVFNCSGVTQIFYWTTQKIEIPPKFLLDPSFGTDGLDFRKVKNVLKEIEQAETIILQRTFGLGDVLMLLPVVRELKGLFPDKKFLIATVESEFRGQMIDLLDEGFVDNVIEQTVVERRNYDIGAYFDWYLERDHATPGFMEMHRIDLYRRFFGLPEGQIPVWSEELERGSDSYIIIHEGGNRDVKSLPRETFKYLVESLSKSYDVKPLSREARIPADEFISLILDASCLVTMDSSPLWVAHFTRTPVVAVLGASRPEERIIYHPLYPEGATAIKLNELINCPPCRECMGRCGGTAKCMQAPKEKVFELVSKAIEEVKWKG